MRGGFSARSPEPPRGALSGRLSVFRCGGPSRAHWLLERLPPLHLPSPRPLPGTGVDFHQTSALAKRRGAFLATGLRWTQLFSLLPAAQDPLPPLQDQPCSPRPSLSLEETYFLFALPRDQPQPQPETPGNPSTHQPTCGTPALPPGLLASHTSGGCFSFLNFI